MGKNTTIQIKRELYDDIKRCAIEENRTVSGFVERILKLYMDKSKKSQSGPILPSIKTEDN